MNLESKINTIGKYYKNKYGYRVFKLGLSTGIECPKRDDPCSFCVKNTFIDDALQHKTITEQIDYLIDKLKKKVKAGGYIAYFHDNTSSYGELEYLLSLFKQADEHPDVLEIIISTRPDYLSIDFLEMLGEIKKPVTIEIGVQTVNDKSLRLLNRGHSQADNQKAIEILLKYPYSVGVHIILGIVEESIKEINNTLNWINRQTIIKDVKIHHLAVFAGSRLAKEIAKKDIINLDDYLLLLAYFIKNLRSDITISRLFTSNLNQHQTMLNDFPGIKREWQNRLMLFLSSSTSISPLQMGTNEEI